MQGLLSVARDGETELYPYVLGSAERDTSDAGNVLQAELANGLASLLLVARVDGDSGTAGDGGLVASLRLGGAAGILNVGLGDLLIGKLFNTGVGHCVLLDKFGLEMCWSANGTVGHDWSLELGGSKMSPQTVVHPQICGKSPKSTVKLNFTAKNSICTYLDAERRTVVDEGVFFALLELGSRKAV